MIDFPDPELADESGLLYVGGNLEVDTLIQAYRQGIFPWPHPGYPLLWFSPKQRGILRFANLHLSRSLKKFLRKTTFKVTVNQDFPQVINACANVLRAGQFETWITEEIKTAYIELFRQGYAHSVECWDQEELVGGLYGVWVGGAFVGESMFFKRDNASKLCLIYLIDLLKAHGHQWMDVQMVTPVIQSLGGEYISREEFLKLWQAALEQHPYESLKI